MRSGNRLWNSHSPRGRVALFFFVALGGLGCGNEVDDWVNDNSRGSLNRDDIDNGSGGSGSGSVGDGSGGGGGGGTYVDSDAPLFEGIFSLTAATDGKPILVWKSANDESTKVKNVRYRIYRTETTLDYDFANPIGEVTGVLTYKDSAANLGVRYYYVVRAVDEEDNEDVNLAELSILTAVPLRFNGLATATAISDSRVQLGWQAATGGLGSLYYRVYRNGTLVGSTQDLSYVVSDLSPLTSYAFSVHVVDSQRGEEANPVQIMATTLSQSYPRFHGLRILERAPGNFGENRLVATWDTASAPSGRSIVGYNVYVAVVGSAFDFNDPLFDTVASSPFTLTGLSADTAYQVVVRAVDSSGFEDRNTVTLTASTAQNQPVVFAGLQSATKGTGANAYATVYLSWQPGSGNFDHYRVFMSPVGTPIDYCSPLRELSPSTIATTITNFDGLSPNTTYQFAVRAALTGTACGAQEDQNTVTRTATTTPNAPDFAGVTSVALPAGNDGLTKVDISFSAAYGTVSHYVAFRRFVNSGDGSTTYDFSLNGGGTAYANAIAVSTNPNTPLRVSGLSTGVAVCFAMRAVYQDNVNPLLQDNQDPSQITEACIIPTASVADFTGLTGSSIAVNGASPTTALDLSWSLPTSGVYDRYMIYVGRTSNEALSMASGGTCPAEIPLCKITLINPNAASYTYSALNPGTQRCFVVQAWYQNAFSDGNLFVQCGSTNPLSNVQLVFTTEPSGTIPGNYMPRVPVVCIRDGDGNAVTGVSANVELTIAQGSGTLENDTRVVNTSTGCATFVSLRFVDSDPTAPTNFRLQAHSDGMASSALTELHGNATGACDTTSNASWKTVSGGCLYIPANIVFSRVSQTTMTWHAAIAGDFDGYENSPVSADSNPTVGYCYDSTESGYTDWRLPSLQAWTDWGLIASNLDGILQKGAVSAGARLWTTRTRIDNTAMAHMKPINSTGVGQSNFKDWSNDMRTICVRDYSP